MVIKLDYGIDVVDFDENGVEVPEPTVEYVKDSLLRINEHQDKCKADALECLRFYFNKENAIDLEFLESWLAKNQPLDRWFFVHLIEIAGQVFCDKSFSAYHAEKASQKNEATRNWVVMEWHNRHDQNQTKAAFARQYANLVKNKFGLKVNPETISRDWLPKTKK